MSTAPMLPPKKPSLMFFQFWPASSVFQTPPPVVPMRNVCVSSAIPVTAVERPPRKGPIIRYDRDVNRVLSCAATGAGVDARVRWAATGEGSVRSALVLTSRSA